MNILGGKGFLQPHGAGLQGLFIQGASIDGKLLCGSNKQKASQPHLLAGLSHKLGLVLRQVAVAEKSNEITASDELIEMLLLKGVVITGDSMFTQRNTAEKIISKGGDYLMSVLALSAIGLDLRE